MQGLSQNSNPHHLPLAYSVKFLCNMGFDQLLKCSQRIVFSLVLHVQACIDVSRKYSWDLTLWLFRYGCPLQFAVFIIIRTNHRENFHSEWEKKIVQHSFNIRYWWYIPSNYVQVIISLKSSCIFYFFERKGQITHLSAWKTSAIQYLLAYKGWQFFKLLCIPHHNWD